MIKLAITGGAIIYSISPVQEIPSKNGGQPFLKRELILDDSWADREGTVHPNYVLVEFTGDKMSVLDGFQPGQRVNVDAVVNGREYNGRVFTTIRGLNVSPYPQQPQQGYAQQAAAPAHEYSQQAAYPQQPAYPQQSAYPQPAAPQSAPFPGQAQTQPQDLGVSGLPFPPNA